jgi:hypothetical protein
MRVETTISAARATVHDPAAHPRLISEARARLLTLGLASEDTLAGDPTMVVSAGDLASSWVNVTFGWGSA